MSKVNNIKMYDERDRVHKMRDDFIRHDASNDSSELAYDASFDKPDLPVAPPHNLMSVRGGDNDDSSRAIEERRRGIVRPKWETADEEELSEEDRCPECKGSTVPSISDDWCGCTNKECSEYSTKSRCTTFSRIDLDNPKGRCTRPEESVSDQKDNQSTSVSIKRKKFKISFVDKAAHKWAAQNPGKTAIAIDGIVGPTIKLKRGTKVTFDVKNDKGVPASFFLTDSNVGGSTAKALAGTFNPISNESATIFVDDKFPSTLYYQDSTTQSAGGLIIVSD